MNVNYYPALSESFPKEVERELRKGGAVLTYIPVSEVITRLNKVLGVDRWSYTVLNCERDSIDPDFIVAHVRLTACFDNNAVVTKDGIGGQRLKRKKDGEILDLGDDMKGAVSDALKKAAQSLGVGLYLARTEEAMYLDGDVYEEPIAEVYFEKLMSMISGLPDGGEKVMLFWNGLSGGKTLERLNVSRSDLDRLISFIKENRDPS